MRTAFRCLIILTFALSMSVAVAAQEASTAPFVYFYSYDDGGFIIQRADGTDRRILTEYALPGPPHEDSYDNHIHGPGWSPSGQWLVWTNGVGADASLVNRDGSIRHSIAEGFTVREMIWNPVRDLLLLELWVEGGELGDYGYTQFRVYDPSKDEVIARINHTSHGKVLSWFPDGSAFAITQSQSVSVFDPEGHLLFGTSSEAIGCRETYSIPHILNTEEIAYLELNGGIAIRNIYTAELSNYFIQGTKLETDSVIWSLDNQYALVHILNSRNFGASLGLASLADNALSPIAGATSPRSTHCDDISQAWNANQQAVFVDNDNRLAIFSPTTQEITSLPFVSVESPRWVGEDIVFIGENTDEANGSHLYRYSTADGSVTILDDSSARYISPPRGNLVIYDMSVLDVSTGEHHDFFHRAPEWEWMGFRAQHVVWHPTEDWAIAGFQDADWHLLGMYVANAEGTIQTHLNWCYKDEASCYGWLPPEISTSEAE